MPTLWKCLDHIQGLAGVPALWRSWLGGEFDTFAPAFLEKRAEPAASHPCAQECGCAHDLVERSDGSFVAVCTCEPWNCDDFAVTPEEAALLELNWPRLGRAICKALECDYRETELHLPLTRQIGSKFAHAVPVVLTIQNDRDEVRQAVAGVVAHLGRPFILLGPTGRFLDANSIGLLHGARAEFFDLDSNVTLLPGGTLQARRSGGELFARFLPERPDGLKQPEAVRIFAILQKLKSKAAGIKAPLCDVFVLTVLDGLTQRAAARKCGCSVGQMSKRVGELEKEFGLPLERLRAFASPILEMQTSVKGERKRERKPGSGPGAFADEQPADDEEESREEDRSGEGDGVG
jgi:hypothetical protein